MDDDQKEQARILAALKSVGVTVDDSADVDLSLQPAALPVFLACCKLGECSPNLQSEMVVQLARLGRRSDVATKLLDFYESLIPIDEFVVNDLRFTVSQVLDVTLTSEEADRLVALIACQSIPDIELRYLYSALAVGRSTACDQLLVSALSTHASSEKALLGALHGTQFKSSEVYREAVMNLTGAPSRTVARAAQKVLRTLE